MKVTDRPILTDDDQRLLEDVQVRLLHPEERERFDQLLVAQHYLKSAALVGEQVRYVAECAGQWVALLAWSAGAYHLSRTAKPGSAGAPRRRSAACPSSSITAASSSWRAVGN